MAQNNVYVVGGHGDTRRARHVWGPSPETQAPNHLRKKKAAAGERWKGWLRRFIKPVTVVVVESSDESLSRLARSFAGPLLIFVLHS